MLLTEQERGKITYSTPPSPEVQQWLPIALSFQTAASDLAVAGNRECSTAGGFELPQYSASAAVAPPRLPPPSPSPPR
jgi:hypothetical protein